MKKSSLKNSKIDFGNTDIAADSDVINRTILEMLLVKIIFPNLKSTFNN